MNRLWMPLFVGDYLGDTGHLTTTQHGAYLLLIMHYWRKGGLPDDERQIAKIAKLSSKAWASHRCVLQEFFHDGWKHTRIEKELAKMMKVAERRQMSGSLGGTASAAARVKATDKPLMQQERGQANAEQTSSNAAANVRDTQTQSQTPTEDRIADAPARGASMLTEGSKARSAAFWKALGFDDPHDVPPEFAGVDVRAVEWEAAGWPVEMIAAEAKRIGPAKPLTYHEKVFATAHAKLHAPLPKVEIRAAETVQVTHAKSQHRSGVVAAARRLADHFEGEPFDRLAPDPALVLRLSQG